MIDFSRFATDDDDAAARAALHSEIDPFRSVPSALLSSAEIHDYARVTGMLSPFYPDALKSASYEAHIGGSVIWWDEHDCRKQKEVGRGDPCSLLPNSITFVEVEPVFRLPNYIAVRFNLRIRTPRPLTRNWTARRPRLRREVAYTITQPDLIRVQYRHHRSAYLDRIYEDHIRFCPFCPRCRGAD
jgi:hypothetical protein